MTGEHLSTSKEREREREREREKGEKALSAPMAGVTARAAENGEDGEEQETANR